MLEVSGHLGYSIFEGCMYKKCGPSSSVGIATDYGPEGPESNPELRSGHRTGRLFSAVRE